MGEVGSEFLEDFDIFGVLDAVNEISIKWTVESIEIEHEISLPWLGMDSLTDLLDRSLWIDGLQSLFSLVLSSLILLGSEVNLFLDLISCGSLTVELVWVDRVLEVEVGEGILVVEELLVFKDLVWMVPDRVGVLKEMVENDWWSSHA